MTPEERIKLEQRSMRSLPVDRIKTLIQELGGHLSEDLKEELFELRMTQLTILARELMRVRNAPDAISMTVNAIAESRSEACREASEKTDER